MSAHQLDLAGASGDLFAKDGGPPDAPQPTEPLPTPQPQPQSSNTQSTMSTALSIGTYTGCAGSFSTAASFFCMK